MSIPSSQKEETKQVYKLTLRDGTKCETSRAKVALSDSSFAQHHFLGKRHAQRHLLVA